MTDGPFRAHLEKMRELRDPWIVFAPRMPWARFEAALAPVFEPRDSAGLG